jgi:hypothetical protein
MTTIFAQFVSPLTKIYKAISRWFANPFFLFFVINFISVKKLLDKDVLEAVLAMRRLDRLGNGKLRPENYRQVIISVIISMLVYMRLLRNFITGKK